MTNDRDSQPVKPTASPSPSAEPAGEPADGAEKSGIDWSDPNVPAGNSPLLPRWPLYLSALAWVGWLAFLLVMAVERTATVAV